MLAPHLLVFPFPLPAQSRFTSLTTSEARSIYLQQADFIMTQMEAGITILMMDFIINLKMEIMYCLIDTSQSESYTYGEDPTLVHSRIEASCIQDCDGEGVQHFSLQGTDDKGFTECATMGGEEKPIPTSEWLEDTLIDLYLAGYPSSVPASGSADELNQFLEKDDEGDSVMFSAYGDSFGQEAGAGEWNHGNDFSSVVDGSFLVEGTSWEEENWKAKYGEVIHEEAVPSLDIRATNLWDWALIKETKKDGTCQVARLVGRLVQPSAKLHPSMPAAGTRLKTAPICQVHLDLVRVKSGQVYRLRSPNAGYIATLSSFDSSDPTKEWGFPELSVTRKRTASEASNSCESSGTDQLPEPAWRGQAYRDRAAERRALHGGFGVGPGQKKSHDDDTSSPTSVSREEAAVEAMDLSFGIESFAQRMLKNMGWKEGESLGKTKQGLKEPLQAVGNMGSAGLGWPKGRMEGP